MIKPTFSNSTPAKSRRGAFTLIEILVAVAIMAVLLTVILVPLRLGFNTFAVGKSRSDVQQNAQLVVNQIALDFRKAQFVFPNSRIEGVSNNAAVTSNCSPAPYQKDPSWDYRPYVISNTNTPATTVSPSTSNYGVCLGTKAWNNLSRIDMLQQRRSTTGQTLNSQAGQDFIVSYYPRRLDVTKPFDVVDNPIVLFRAQIPFRGRVGNDPGADYKIGSDYNANIDWTQLPPTLGTCTAGESNRSFLWLTHNYYGEADLQPLTTDEPSGVPGAHTLVTPSDMSLVAPKAGSGDAESMVPELTFQEESTDGKRIDRVTITMTLAQYDTSGAGSTNGQASAQRVRVSQTVELPNVSCGIQ